jgi:hypothetical protein
MCKTCSGCDADPARTPDNFSSDKNSPDGLFHRCKVCEADRVNIYYYAHQLEISDTRYQRRNTDADYAERERERTRERVARYRARQREQLAASA